MDLNKLSFHIGGSTDSATSAIDRLIVSLDALNATFSKIASVGVKSMGTLSTGTQKAVKPIKNVSTHMSVLSAKMNLGGVSIGNFVKKLANLAVAFLAFRKAIQAFVYGAQQAIAYVENLNLFMVALGENTSRAVGFIKEMSESLYLDEAQLTRVQGLFYQISESLGLSSEKAYTLSENFTKLAYDLASFYNITVEAAVTKLQAGLVGETEPLRRIGIIITENNLAETARAIGIRKSIRNMTEQEKIQLRYITALQQTKNAQGDLARTLKQPENLLRILREQFHVFARELGNSVIPLLQQVVPQVIGLMMALTKIAERVAKSFGYEAPVIRDDLGGYIKTVGEELEGVDKSTKSSAKSMASLVKYSKALDSTMTGIDELNIVDNTFGAKFDSLFNTEEITESTTAIDEALEAYNNNMAASKGIFDDIIGKWDTLLAKLDRVFTGTFDKTKQAFDDLWRVIRGDEPLDEDKIFGGIKTTLAFMDTVIAGILDGVKNTYIYFYNLWINAIKPIMDKIAPNWMGWLQDGTLQTAVSTITTAFLMWKTITVSASLLSGLMALMHIGANSSTLITALGALATVGNIAIAFTNPEVSESVAVAQELKSRLFTALALALPVGMFNPILGVITFNIAFAVKDLPMKMLEGVFKLFGASEQEATNSALLAMQNLSTHTGKTEYVDEKTKAEFQKSYAKIPDEFAWFKSQYQKMVLDQPAILAKLVEYFVVNPDKDITDPRQIIAATRELNLLEWLGQVPAFASGGAPQKGSLFIAGEAGPELVGNINGKTEVIPMYANGTTVPKWTNKEIQNAIDYSASGTKPPDITENFNKIFTGIETGLLSIPKMLGKGIDSLFTWIMPKTTTFVKGLAGNVYNAGVTVFDELKVGADNFKTFITGVSKTDFVQTLDYMIKKVGKVASVVGNAVAQTFTAFAGDAGMRQVMRPTATGGTTKQQQGIAGGIIEGLLGDSWAGMIFNLMRAINDEIVLQFINSLPTFIQSGMDMLTGLIEGVVKALPQLISQIPVIIDQIVSILTNKETLNALITGMVQLVAQLVVALPDIIFALVDAIPSVIFTIIDVFMKNLPLFFKLGVVIAAALLEGLANIIVAGINIIIDSINWLLGWAGVNIKKLDPVDMTSGLLKTMGFAEGGYPVQGQMFIAREAGAELVGNINGRTGVMNNEQIVESVSRGVYQAVKAAMAEQGKQEVIVNLDGKRVSERLDVAQRTRGLSFGMGGY